MDTKTSYKDFFSGNDFTKLFEGYQNMPFDVNSLMETQRKNFQALSSAQQLSAENLQTIMQKQTALMSQMMEDQTKLAREIMGEGSPETKISKNAAIFKKIYERSVKNMREIGEMMSQSGMETSDIINQRVSATMNEIQSSVEKAAPERQKKKAA